MNILKSSKLDGKLSRTLKGVVVLLVLVLASVGVDISQEVILDAVYQVAVALSALYAAYGAVLKVYNKVTGDHK